MYRRYIEDCSRRSHNETMKQVETQRQQYHRNSTKSVYSKAKLSQNRDTSKKLFKDFQERILVSRIRSVVN